MGDEISDVVVVGGGLIGCAVAGELARRGLRVTVVDRGEPGSGASSAAAGMLSPLSESAGPGAFLALAESSLSLYDEFVARLEGETGISVGYRRSGKLEVATDERGEARLRSAHEWRLEAGHESIWLSTAEARSLEPALSPEVRAGLLDPNDHQVENRALVRAAWISAARAGVRFRLGKVVTGLAQSSGRVSGVVLAGGERLESEWVVVAAGCWSGQLSGLPRPLPLRPVRGQIVVLQSAPSPISRVVGSGHGYLVPRADGRVLVGATMEEAGFAARTTGAGVGGLLAAALAVVPTLAEAEVVELRAGLRPGTPDGLPILGSDPEVEGLFYACGHFRNGILLAPITARLIAEGILEDRASTPIAPFAADRFEVVRV